MGVMMALVIDSSIYRISKSIRVISPLFYGQMSFNDQHHVTFRIHWRASFSPFSVSPPYSGARFIQPDQV